GHDRAGGSGGRGGRTGGSGRAGHGGGGPMRILIWHLHGSWLTSFVQGPHDYLVPVTPERGPFGLGRARTWDWPASVGEVSPRQLGGGDGDPGGRQGPE